MTTERKQKRRSDKVNTVFDRLRNYITLSLKSYTFDYSLIIQSFFNFNSNTHVWWFRIRNTKLSVVVTPVCLKQEECSHYV